MLHGTHGAICASLHTYDETQQANVLTCAGLRAVLKKDPEAFKKLVDLENVDMLCLQEIKLQDKHVVELTDQLGLDGWASHFNCSTDKLGYSGVAIVYRKDAFEEEPVITSGIGLSTHDGEGRVITAELADKFVVNTYVPNSGAPHAEPDRAACAAVGPVNTQDLHCVRAGGRIAQCPGAAFPVPSTSSRFAPH